MRLWRSCFAVHAGDGTMFQVAICISPTALVPVPTPVARLPKLYPDFRLISVKKLMVTHLIYIPGPWLLRTENSSEGSKSLLTPLAHQTKMVRSPLLACRTSPEVRAAPAVADRPRACLQHLPRQPAGLSLRTAGTPASAGHADRTPGCPGIQAGAGKVGPGDRCQGSWPCKRHGCVRVCFFCRSWRY